MLGPVALEGSPGVYRTAARGSAVGDESGVPVFGDVFGWGEGVGGAGDGIKKPTVEPCQLHDLVPIWSIIFAPSKIKEIPALIEVMPTTWIYRITHHQNLEHILRDGLLMKRSASQNQDFFSIGDKTLIQVRDEITVPVPPDGVLSDCVPFYFGLRSPMLYEIHKGFDGVQIDTFANQTIEVRISKDKAYF